MRMRSIVGDFPAKCVRLCRAWRADRGGVTGVEYALIAGGISMVIVAAAIIFGGTLQGVYTAITASAANFTGP